MSKVLLIGIDGLDPDLVNKWQNDLPFFRKLASEGYTGKIESVFPPDSVPAWATIFTGKTPAQHGITGNVNYLDSKSKRIDISNIVGNTFWDIASKRGKKVCIINPFLCYPVWPVNGVMISGPVMIDGDVQTYPHEIKLEGSLPNFGGITDFPDKKDLGTFISKNTEDIEKLYNFAKYQFQKEDYDLKFVTFLQLDRVQHFLWRYTDPEDITHPGPNKYSESIKRYYQLIDKIIGQFFDDIDSQTAMIIVSDHGHGRRCTKILNINEVFRRAGYLKSKVGRFKYFDFKYLLEKTKLGILGVVYRFDLEDLMYAMTKYIPNRKALKNSTFITDTNKSLVSVSTFGGTNPFGGITLNRKKINQAGLDYDDFRIEIIRLLKNIRDDKTGQNPFLWLKFREDVDNGPFLEIYPDIVFELEESYGVNWALHTKICGLNPTHKKISGGHKRYGYCGIFNFPYITKNGNIHLKDIRNIIINLLEMNKDRKN